MKKALAIILSVILLLSLAACETVPDTPNVPDTSAREEEPKQPITLVVSPAGSTADGSMDKPFSSIEKAVKSAFLADSDKYSNVTVLIKEGLYNIDSTITIEKVEGHAPVRIVGEGNVTVSGTTESELFLVYGDGVTIENLKFTSVLGNGIAVSADNFSLLNCEITGVRGEYAVKAVGNNLTIEGNHIHDCSGSAIIVSGGDLETLTKSSSKIYNNLISDFGTSEDRESVGIGAYGVDVVVSHNEICNSTDGAIEFRGGYITLEYNKISDVLTSGKENGAITTSGIVQVGNVIRYNHIQNVGDRANPATNESKSCGIKCEDAASYYEVYGNIIESVTGNGIKLDSRCATIRNNLLIDCTNWYIWHVTSGYTNFFKWRNDSLVDVPDYIYSPVWKSANPDLASIVTDMGQTTFTDPRSWAAPTGIVLENNWVHYNRYGRAFNNWGTAPYSVDEAVFRFSGETLDLEGSFDHGSKNISIYNSKRNKLVFEDLFREAGDVIDMDMTRFDRIGRVTDEQDTK